jgi:hypothetical protein
MAIPDMSGLRLGQEVLINDKSDYEIDHRGETYFVIGFDLEMHGRVSVTIGQTGNFRWENSSDGWRPDELTPA